MRPLVPAWSKLSATCGAASRKARMAAGVGEHLAPHRLARYARDVAGDFHQFYTECKILTEERELRLARLALCLAAKSVLARTLALVGVAAPDSM